MDKLTELVFEMTHKDLSIMEITDQLEEIGIQYKTPDDEHWYWYYDGYDYGDEEFGAYDIEELPFPNGVIDQSLFDEMVELITKYINENSN